MQLHHQNLIAIGQHIIDEFYDFDAYQLDVSGICNGVAGKRVEAICEGNQGILRLNSLFALMASEKYTNPNDLSSAIKITREKQQQVDIDLHPSSLTEEDKLLLEIPGLFKGIAYHQNPHYFSKKIFGKRLGQHQLTEIACFSITDSDSDEEESLPLTEMIQANHILTRGDLLQYLKGLEAIFSFDIGNIDISLNANIGIRLACDEHTVSVYFDTVQRAWVYYDAENLTSQSNAFEIFGRIVNTQQLADDIFQSFCDDSNEHTVFTASYCRAKQANFSNKQQLLSLVNSVVDEHSHCRQSNNNEITLLDIACDTGDVELLDRLLNAYSDTDLVNRCENRIKTPLFRACYYGQLAVAKRLLRDQRIQFTVEYNKNSPFYFVCKDREIDLISTLLDKATDIGLEAYLHLYLYLCFAYENQYFDVVKCVIEHDRVDVTALFLQASDECYDAIIDVLIENCSQDLGCKDAVGNTLLHRMCLQNVSQGIDKLLNGIVNIDAVNDEGKTALQLACENACLDIARQLLDSAYPIPDVSDFDESARNTLFYLLCETGRVADVRCILATVSVDVDHCPHVNYPTVLGLACQRGDLVLLQLLLQQPGIEVNKTPGHNYDSPLLLLCRNQTKDRLSILDQLLAREDIELSINDGHEQSLIYYACEHNDLHLFSHLLSHQKIQNTLDLNQCNKQSGMNVLHLACNKGHLAMVIMLLEQQNIDVTRRDSTIKQYSSVRYVSDPAIFQQLMRHFNNSNIDNSMYESELFHTVICSGASDSKSIDLLIDCIIKDGKLNTSRAVTLVQEALNESWGVECKQLIYRRLLPHAVEQKEGDHTLSNTLESIKPALCVRSDDGDDTACSQRMSSI